MNNLSPQIGKIFKGKLCFTCFITEDVKIVIFLTMSYVLKIFFHPSIDSKSN